MKYFVATFLLIGLSLASAIYWLKNAPTSNGTLETTNQCVAIGNIYSLYSTMLHEFPSSDPREAFLQLTGKNSKNLAIINPDNSYLKNNGIGPVDAWDRPLRITVKERRVLVASAGRDHKFDTSDDLSNMPREAEQSIPLNDR